MMAGTRIDRITDLLDRLPKVNQALCQKPGTEEDAFHYEILVDRESG
jgi:hypothetical protein